MRAALLLPLLLSLCQPAGAFFFGKTSDRRAAELLDQTRAAYESADCQTALELAEKFLAEKPPAGMRERVYGYMGSCYETCGSPDKAISLYKLALGLYPDNILFSRRLALIYNGTGFPQLAVPLFAKVLAVKSDDIEANLGLARAYAAQGFLLRAKGYYSRAVILQDFRDAAALEEYARWMLKKGDWAEVAYISAKGAQTAPRSSVWPALEARALAGQGKYYKAIEFMEAAIRLQPSRALRLERALYLLMGGLPKRAMAAAEEELSAGADPLASMVKGMALYALGRKPEAAPSLSAGRETGPFAARVAAALLGDRPLYPEGSCGK
ncbi:MAG: tetratricopeptide repeat protein [Elusimicrobiales bacterium]